MFTEPSKGKEIEITDCNVDSLNKNSKTNKIKQLPELVYKMINKNKLDAVEEKLREKKEEEDK